MRWYKTRLANHANWPDPTNDQEGALQTMISDAPPAEVKEFLKAHDDVYQPRMVTFQDAGSGKPADPIIVIYIDGFVYYVIEDVEDMDTLVKAEEWIRGIPEYDLANYVPYRDFNEEFWTNPGILYHATNPENVADIKRNGLRPSSNTRAISNRGMAPAVFTSTDPEQIDSYGSVIIAIDADAMRSDGYMPMISGEEPFEEADMREALASRIGLEGFDAHEGYAWEGLSTDTVAIFGPVPPKYLTFS